MQETPHYEGQPLNPQMISTQFQQQTNVILMQTSQMQQGYGLPLITDQVRFEHHYEHTRPLCSDHHKTSRFNIPGIGEFVYDVKQPCCRPTVVCSVCSRCCPSCCSCEMFTCDPHFYPYLIYEISAGQLKIKFFDGGFAKIFYGLRLLGEVVQAKPNIFDLFGGRICSAYPQFHIEEQDTKRSYQLRPDSSAMPTCQYNFMCLPQSIFGFFRNIRPVLVKDYNGNSHPIKISNERNLQSKCRAHCCPCIPCCDTPNYPEFDIQFDPSIQQVERILVLSTLVMMSFYDHWALIGFMEPRQVLANSYYKVTTV